MHSQVHQTGGGMGGSSYMKPKAGTNAALSQTRIMAPWAKMRSVETNIQGVLSHAKYSSTDMAAHTAAKQAGPRIVLW